MSPARLVLLALTITWSYSATAVSAGGARLAIIIDDIGYNQTMGERAARLPGAFTLSVLPFTPHGTAIAQLAHRQGKELMLHTPMSNLGNLPLGQGGLYSSMNKNLLVATFRQDLNNLPFIKGINNHMGSRLTQESEPMNWVMEELRSRGLYFVDSRTSAQTKAFDVARAYHIPSLKRDIFLDDVQESGAIRHQLMLAITIARQRGSAVAIGHPYPATILLLEGIQSVLSQQRVELVFISQLLPAQIPLLAEKEVQLDYCAAPPGSLWFIAKQNVYLSDTVAFLLFDLFAIK